MKAQRVLVVEDDALIAMLLVEMLEDMGHGVCASERTAAGALAAAIGCEPDLMIVDVQLGREDGISLVDAITHKGPVPHVFMSGDLSRLRIRKPNALYIQKPYREPDLIRVIQHALSGASTLVDPPQK